MFQRRAVAANVTRGNAGERARLMHLQELLAQIPSEPSVVVTNVQHPSVEMQDVGEEIAVNQGQVDQGEVDSNACSICHHELIVRVALQPCGHTACRDCILRLIERECCHVCDAKIQGVQPVYI